MTQELVETELREFYLAYDAAYDPAPGLARVCAHAGSEHPDRASRITSLPSRDRPALAARWRRILGRGRGRSWRVTAVWLAVALAGTGAAAAAISLSEGSSPPVRLPGGTGLCPLGFPYAAEANQLVYPPNYPGLPVANKHITACFASTQDALSAGYRLAPPPAGDSTLGPLYLAPTPAAVRRTCRAAQRLTHAIVYCPSRLPAGWFTDTTGDPDCPTAGCAAPLLSISGTFPDPGFSTVPDSIGESNASMWAASASQLRHYPVPLGCGAAAPNAHTRLVGHTSFRGHPAGWYLCPQGGPLMLKWRIGRESYGITADGPTSLRRRLIEYIAARLIPERPG